MEKFKSVFYKVMMALLLIMSLIATVGALFNFYKTTKDHLSPFVIILGVIVLILFFISISSLIKKISDKKKNIIAVILCILFFVALSIFGIKFTIIPSYDLSHVERELMLMMEDGTVISNATYFAKYVNQVPLTILLYYVYRLGMFLHVGNLKLFAVVINSLFMAITAFFTYLSGKKLGGSNLALISLLFFIINPIFYMYASYFYTDTLCMPFAAISIYLFLSSKDKEKFKGIITLLLSGFLLAIGFKVRVVVAILLIGIILTLWLNSEKMKTIFKTSLCLVGGFVIGIISYNLIALNFTIPKDDTLEFPIYHWVMMGLNDKKTGRYSDTDHTYTKSQPNKEAKKDADIKKIKERLHDLGVFGYLGLTARKININWSNGAYRYLDKMANIDNFSSGYEYVGGNNLIFTLYALQICKGLILVVFTYLVFLELTSKNNKKTRFIMVSLFGAFLFYVIWEVQARYSLSFLPWMMLLFPFGIKAFEENVTSKIMDNGKLKKIIPCSFIVLTIGLLLVNFPKYTIKKSYFYDTRINQVKTRSTPLTNLEEKDVLQTFKTKGQFNNISLKFIKKDVNSTTNYIFTLYNKDGKVLYQEDFTSDDVLDNEFKDFTFDTIKPDGEEEYSIGVKSSDASENNSIGLEAFEYHPYKAYPNGTLKINDEDAHASLTFKVQDRVKRTYTSKTFYILMSLIILLIEGVSFYPYIKRQK